MSHVAIHKIVTNEKIYKVAYVVNNKIKTMYVFIGKPPIKSNIKKLNLDNLFLQDSSNDVFASVFSPEEKADIIEYNTTVKFISEGLVFLPFLTKYSISLACESAEALSGKPPSSASRPSVSRQRPDQNLPLSLASAISYPPSFFQRLQLHACNKDSRHQSS